MDDFDAIVDVDERSGLLAVAPDLQLVSAVESRDLPRQRRRSIFAAAIIGAERAVDVVKADDPRRKMPIPGEVLTELLRIELLKAVAFFRISAFVTQPSDCSAITRRT